MKAEVIQELDVDPAVLTADQLPGLLDECQRLEDWIAGIRQRAKELIASGETVRGWRVLEVRRHDVIDQEAAFTRIWTDYGREIALRSVKLSLPMAAAALAGSIEITRKQAQARLKRTLNDLVVESITPRLWRERE
jgi:hypothetical protein